MFILFQQRVLVSAVVICDYCLTLILVYPYIIPRDFTHTYIVYILSFISFYVSDDWYLQWNILK